MTPARMTEREKPVSAVKQMIRIAAARNSGSFLSRSFRRIKTEKPQRTERCIPDTTIRKEVPVRVISCFVSFVSA